MWTLVTVEGIMTGRQEPEGKQSTDKGRSTGSYGALKGAVKRVHN